MVGCIVSLVTRLDVWALVLWAQPEGVIPNGPDWVLDIGLDMRFTWYVGPSCEPPSLQASHCCPLSPGAPKDTPAYWPTCCLRPERDLQPWAAPWWPRGGHSIVWGRWGSNLCGYIMDLTIKSWEFLYTHFELNVGGRRKSSGRPPAPWTATDKQIQFYTV